MKGLFRFRKTVAVLAGAGMAFSGPYARYKATV